MKMIQRKTILLLVLLAGFGITSCDLTGLTDAVDDFGVIIGLEPINTTATVQLVDAATGELIASNTTVDFSGANGDDVIDIYSDPLPEDEVDDGILNFGIDNSVTPSESNPAEIQLILEANGYITTAKTISISSEGRSDFFIRMVRENNKPQGVKTTSNTEGSADGQGTVQNDFSLSSNSDTNAEAGTSIEITSGTVFKNASGNNLTGQLTTSLSYYTPSEVAAMASLPVDLVDNEGNPIIVAGASQVSVTDANGRRAATAEASAKSKIDNNGPLSYTFKIPSSVINPIAGRPYNEGDNVVILNFDNDFNLTIAVGTIEILASGGLGVKYTSSVVPLISVIGNPLSASAESCSANVTINRNGNSGELIGRVFTSGFVSEFRIPHDGSQYSISQLPDVDVTVEIQTPSGALVSLEEVNVCGSITIDLPAPTAPLIDATVNVSLECANPNEKITVTSIPSASILYRLSGEAGQGRPWRSATNIEWNQDTSDNNRITGGSFDVSSVVQGEDYDFTVKIDTEKRTKTLEITGPTVNYTEEIDSGICSS